MNTIKNINGFGSPLLLTFMALFSSLLIVAAFVRFSIDSRSDFRYFCYSDLYKVQKILINHEQRLMALNHLAHSLRLKLRALYFQLAAAVATENIPLVLQINQWILQTKQQQRTLKMQQQMIIAFGNNYARIELARSYKELIASNRTRSIAWSEILQINDSIILNTWSPTMAVAPDDQTDIAPAYSFNPGFENQQRIIATWTFWFFAKPIFQTLIPAQHNWRLQCSVEPKFQSVEPKFQSVEPKFQSVEPKFHSVDSRNQLRSLSPIVKADRL